MTRRSVVCVAMAALTLGAGAGWGFSRVSAKGPSLSTQDYVDIQNLYNTYTRYVDMGGDDDGSGLLSLFTPDGAFNSAKAPDGLTKMVKGYHDRLRKEAWSSRHIYTGLVITPAPEGAKGSVYLLTFNVTAKPPFVDHSGVYEDWLVKTKTGWKWKKRLYRPSESFKPATPQGMDEIFGKAR